MAPKVPPGLGFASDAHSPISEHRVNAVEIIVSVTPAARLNEPPLSGLVNSERDFGPFSPE